MACARLHFRLLSLSLLLFLSPRFGLFPPPSQPSKAKQSKATSTAPGSPSRPPPHALSLASSFPQQQRQPPRQPKKNLKVDAEQSRLASSISTTPVCSTRAANRDSPPTKPTSKAALLPFTLFCPACPESPRQRRGTRCSRGALQPDSSSSTLHPASGLLQASHLPSP